MQEGKFSRTARRVAIRRAAHQLLDHPRVLDDPLALRIIGAEAAEELRSNPKEHHAFSRAFRAFMAARSRYAEDELAGAVERGVRQYVVLGAGLDTFAYRNPHAGLRVFEVDHPATQAWKREQLSAAGIAIPAALTFVPVDFERQTSGGGTWAVWIRLGRGDVFLLAGGDALSHSRRLHVDFEFDCDHACGQRSGI